MESDAELYSRLWNEERRDRIARRLERAGMSEPDRSFPVPPGHVVKTGYVDIFRVSLACRERMAVGDVDRAYQRAIRTTPAQPHPCPYGEWKDDNFVIRDGRHAYVAYLMLGFEQLLVSWTEPA